MEQIEIGKRLREVRLNYLENIKLSIPDFAIELGESKYNIANYERGIANIPNRLLVSLYEKGFNPIYILTGEGSMFADNKTGKLRFSKIKQSEPLSEIEENALKEKLNTIMVAAGDIEKILKGNQ